MNQVVDLLTHRKIDRNEQHIENRLIESIITKLIDDKIHQDK